MQTMSDRDGLIWLDGAMVPWREAKVHVLTYTLHYGMGVFEGLRAYANLNGSAIFRLHDHTRRLLNSAKILNMQVPYTAEQLNAAQKNTVKQNGLKSAYIRPMCFYGAEGMGLRADHLQVHCMIAAWEWGQYLGDNALEKGIRVKTSSFSRHHVNSNMCKAKSNGSYMNSSLALNEAMSAGFDEALILDTDGFVAEGSGENIFIVRNGVLYTPDLAACLDGITRDTVCVIAAEIGLEVREQRISRDEAYIADEAFFTGTAAEITPICEIDHRPIGNGSRGPITEKLQAMYFDCVHGRKADERGWLEYL